MEKVLTVLLLVGSVYFALLALPCFTLRTPREPIFAPMTVPAVCWVSDC